MRTLDPCCDSQIASSQPTSPPPIIVVSFFALTVPFNTSTAVTPYSIPLIGGRNAWLPVAQITTSAASMRGSSTCTSLFNSTCTCSFSIWCSYQEISSFPSSLNSGTLAQRYMPPSWFSFSTSVTVCPRSAKTLAASIPAGPPPMTRQFFIFSALEKAASFSRLHCGFTAQDIRRMECARLKQPS